MKILKNRFYVELDEWSDPGVYPSGAGSSPLPSYNYVCEVPGELVIQLEPGDLDPDGDPEEQYQEFAQEHADLPSGISVTEWAWSVLDNKITLSVQNFDASDYSQPEKGD